MAATQQLTIFKQIFLCLIVAKCLHAAVIPNTINANKIRAEYEQLAEKETENFLNNMFQSQIDFLEKLQVDLPTSTKRAQDVVRYIDRLKNIIREKNLDQKDKMWMETFNEFKEPPLLLNDEKDTGMTDEQYLNLLKKHGLEKSVNDFLIDVATYFWKMAKASGKIIETTIDEYLKNLNRQHQALFISRY